MLRVGAVDAGPCVDHRGEARLAHQREQRGVVGGRSDAVEVGPGRGEAGCVDRGCIEEALVSVGDALLEASGGIVARRQLLDDRPHLTLGAKLKI